MNANPKPQVEREELTDEQRKEAIARLLSGKAWKDERDNARYCFIEHARKGQIDLHDEAGALVSFTEHVDSISAFYALKWLARKIDSEIIIEHVWMEHVNYPARGMSMEHDNSYANCVFCGKRATYSHDAETWDGCEHLIHKAYRSGQFGTRFAVFMADAREWSQCECSAYVSQDYDECPGCGKVED
jgi:hypothetical protein